MPIKSSLLSFADLEPLGKQALEGEKERKGEREEGRFAFFCISFICVLLFAAFFNALFSI